MSFKDRVPVPIANPSRAKPKLERAVQSTRVRQKQPKAQKPPPRKPPKTLDDYWFHRSYGPGARSCRKPYTYATGKGIPGIDLLQYYELLIDSRRLQLINPESNIKVTGLKARTDVYRITGLMPDIHVDFQTLIA
ncbi:unnamed protein product [Echinostoma caproni]|uniref:Uncharacterized protein n=1 Tax=Echinostoma caproni TaxID=27848 RepID=A0A3P8H3F0_9TREM|nr:unnamed protein product [Echinostoma caproni]